MSQPLMSREKISRLAEYIPKLQPLLKHMETSEGYTRLCNGLLFREGVLGSSAEEALRADLERWRRNFTNDALTFRNLVKSFIEIVEEDEDE